MNRHYSPHQLVVQAFRGTRKTAAIVGLDVAQVSRWQRTGLIPSRYQRRVLEEAWARGVDLTAHDIIFGRPRED